MVLQFIYACFFQAQVCILYGHVTVVQTCALPISSVMAPDADERPASCRVPEGGALTEQIWQEVQAAGVGIIGVGLVRQGGQGAIRGLRGEQFVDPGGGSAGGLHGGGRKDRKSTRLNSR